MKNYLKYIGGAIFGVALVLGASVAKANEYPAQLTTYTVIGSGISAGATSFTLNSFNDIYGNPITMSYFGAVGYGTLEPSNGSQEEAVSFTSVTDNANGTVTLGGVQDTGLNYPFATTTNGIQINHAGGVTFVITNTAAWYYNIFPIIQNPSVITNDWTFASTTYLTATSTASTSIPNLGQVQSLLGSATSSILGANNTWTGTNTYNGLSTFVGNATFNTVLPTSSLTPTGSTQLATKGYVDGVAIAGGVVATNALTGISRIASLSQIQSSFSSSTAYVIPSSLASSIASTTSSVVVVSSSTTGLIDPSFLPASSFYFGPGTDGSTTIAANSTTTLTRDMYYTNLTVNGTLITEGYRVFVNNIISGSGIIEWGVPANGVGGGNAGAVAAGGAATTTGGIFKNASGASNNGANSSGGTTASSTNPGMGTPGGQGGAATYSGGTSVISTSSYPYGVFSFNTINFLAQSTSTGLFVPYITGMGGGGGGAYISGGNNATGGGGGASCGSTFVMSYIWSGSFSYYCMGGQGGGPGTFGGIPAGGGGGGSGGAAITIFATKTWSGSYNLFGGNSNNGGTVGASGTPYEININNLIR